MKRTLFHLALGSAVVTTALGAGFVTRSGPTKCKSGAPILKTTVTTYCYSSPAARNSMKYHGGVCLILGTYSFTGPNGQPLRYVSPASNGLPAFEDEDALNVSFKGTGDVYQLEFTYTGFVVENGKILTTRRAAEPWAGGSDNKRILGFGGKPRLEKLTAYFPASKTPFTLTVDKISTESNLAMCTFNPEGENIPSLPLADSLAADPSGQAVVLMGFPTGVDGILAKAYPGTENGPKVEPIDPAAFLASSGELLPEVSTGVVSRLVAGRLTHTAPTAESGAGSPLFGPDGTVIGVCEVLPPPGPMEDRVPGLNLAVSLQEVRAFLDGKSTKTVVTKTTKKG